jgi:hypothetical protein
MLNRTHILSLAAVAAIGAVAFVTSASAKPTPVLQRATSFPISKPMQANSTPIKVNSGVLHAVNSVNSGAIKPINPVVNPIVKPSLPPAVAFKKPIDIDCVTFKGCDHDKDHDKDHDGDHDHDWDHHHHWMVWWHQPHYGVVDYTTVNAPIASAPVASASTPAPCNCLTKQYLQDGSVLFTDLCTKEEAMATPAELQAQAQGVSPQAH